MNNYYWWGLDQHPASQIYQMEKQIIEWDIFISIFYYSKIFKQYLSKKIYCLKDIKDFDFSDFSEKEKKKILDFKNCWIFKTQNWKKKIKKMWDWEKIIYPFSKKETEKGKLKKLLILRDAYSWTDKQKEVLGEIEKIEKELEMTIEEFLNK